MTKHQPSKYSLSTFFILILDWKDFGNFKFGNRIVMREASDLDQVRHHLEGIEGSDVLESVENTEGGPEILGPQETLSDGGEVGGEVTEDHPHLVHAERLVVVNILGGFKSTDIRSAIGTW